MKPSVYIETSVVSYLVAWQSRDLVTAAHQATTRQWWETRSHDFDLFFSELVWQEAAAGDPREADKRKEVLNGLSELLLRDEVEDFAGKLLASGVLPDKAKADALHISYAAVYGMAYLLTWNCRHINNMEIIWQVEEACKRNNYLCPRICTPEQLLGRNW